MKTGSLYSIIDSAFVVSGEMKKGNGEDSYAYAINEKIGFISVFDGCGGIGSRQYEELGNKTGAYIASRVIADTVLKTFNEFCLSQSTLNSRSFDDFCKNMKINSVTELSEINNKTRKTTLKGSLSKDFPTTMSAIFFDVGNNSGLNLYYVWAGDSRGYLLQPFGLMQITNDDVFGNEDSFSNLSNDGNLSNFMCADGSFHYNKRILECPKRSILISATDGCFGYFSTPMEFEFMLLDTLIVSSSINEWKEKISNFISQYTGDDYTLCVAVSGFGSYKQLRHQFKRRHSQLYKKYISKIHDSSKDSLLEMWKDYKKVYYRRYMK